MNKNDKKLLLRDLTARIPYGAQLSVEGFEDLCTLKGVVGDVVYVRRGDGNEVSVNIEEKTVKPYLYSLSWLKEFDYSPNARYFKHLDELIELLNQCNLGRVISEKNFNYQSFGVLWFCNMSPSECVPHQAMDVVIDYLDSNHIDHRGLVSEGLAIQL